MEHQNYQIMHSYAEQQFNYRNTQSDYTIINDNEPEITQPNNIKTQLFIHQRKAVHKMINVEQTHKIIKNNIELNTNVAIYADKVGAGKTLTITTLLSTAPSPISQTRRILSSNEYSSITRLLPENISSSNLLIVPHSLINQWKNTLNDSTDLHFTVINKNAYLDNIEWTNLPHTVLISNTIFKNMTVPRTHTWSRVIIDEPQSLPLRQIPKANFTWLVCATPKDIIYPRRNYLRSVAREMCVDYRNLTNMIVIKNKDATVDASLRLPAIQETYITCKAPRLFHAISSNLPQEALVRLQANDIRGAAEILNINAAPNDNIVDLLIGNYMDQIHNQNIEISRLQGLRNLSITDRNQRIKTHQEKINDIQSKINDIKIRIDSDDITCPICLESVAHPKAITGCCKNAFCFECILMALSVDYEKKCPLCKKCGCDKNLHVDNNSNPTLENVEQDNQVDVNGPKNKTDTIIDILKSVTPTDRFLVFSEFYNSFNRIKFKMDELGIRYAILKGSVDTQQKMIDKYTNGDIQILLLNASQFGAGLNLQMTTHVCVFHKFRDNTLKEQVIGRANRFGRTAPLEVIYLAHEGEY
jgi:SNF2 family DNA or RNA helicase